MFDSQELADLEDYKARMGRANEDYWCIAGEYGRMPHEYEDWGNLGDQVDDQDRGGHSQSPTDDSSKNSPAGSALAGSSQYEYLSGDTWDRDTLDGDTCSSPEVDPTELDEGSPPMVLQSWDCSSIPSSEWSSDDETNDRPNTSYHPDGEYDPPSPAYPINGGH